MNAKNEVKLFNQYVDSIYERYSKSSITPVWTDFPIDLHDDKEHWSNRKSISEIKSYIDFVKSQHPHVNESAVQFWSHWLSYKNKKMK